MESLEFGDWKKTDLELAFIKSGNERLEKFSDSERWGSYFTTPHIEEKIFEVKLKINEIVKGLYGGIVGVVDASKIRRHVAFDSCSFMDELGWGWGFVSGSLYAGNVSKMGALPNCQSGDTISILINKEKGDVVVRKRNEVLSFSSILKKKKLKLPQRLVFVISANSGSFEIQKAFSCEKLPNRIHLNSTKLSGKFSEIQLEENFPKISSDGISGVLSFPISKKIITYSTKNNRIVVWNENFMSIASEIQVEKKIQDWITFVPEEIILCCFSNSSSPNHHVIITSFSVKNGLITKLKDINKLGLKKNDMIIRLMKISEDEFLFLSKFGLIKVVSYSTSNVRNLYSTTTVVPKKIISLKNSKLVLSKTYSNSFYLNTCDENHSIKLFENFISSSSSQTSSDGKQRRKKKKNLKESDNITTFADYKDRNEILTISCFVQQNEEILVSGSVMGNFCFYKTSLRHHSVISSSQKNSRRGEKYNFVIRKIRMVGNHRFDIFSIHTILSLSDQDLLFFSGCRGRQLSSKRSDEESSSSSSGYFLSFGLDEVLTHEIIQKFTKPVTGTHFSNNCEVVELRVRDQININDQQYIPVANNQMVKISNLCFNGRSQSMDFDVLILCSEKLSKNVKILINRISYSLKRNRDLEFQDSMKLSIRRYFEENFDVLFLNTSKKEKKLTEKKISKIVEDLKKIKFDENQSKISSRSTSTENSICKMILEKSFLSMFEKVILNDNQLYFGEGYNDMNEENSKIIPNGYGIIFQKRRRRSYHLKKSYFCTPLFQGNFIDGKRSGPGTKYDPKSKTMVFEGDFLDDLREGKGMEFTSIKMGKSIQQVLAFQGTFKKGLRDGRGEEYDPKSGKTTKGCWKEGKLDKNSVMKYDFIILDFRGFREHLEPSKVLGSGGYGSVYKLERNLIPELRDRKNFGEYVAVKVMKVNSSIERKIIFKMIRRAVALISGIVKSKHLLQIHAVFSSHGSVGYVMELAKVSLDKLLRSGMMFEEKVRIIYETACGIRDLHKAKVMHRDLKWSNVMMNRHGAVKICDFDTIKEDDHNWRLRLRTQTSNIGTYSYIAPEVYSGKNYTLKCDVYAFSLMMCSLLAERLDPFYDPYFDDGWDDSKQQYKEERGTKCPKCGELIRDIYRTNSLGFHVSKCRLRPLIFENDLNAAYTNLNSVPNYMKELIVKCWNHNPSERPSFDEIVEILENSEMKRRCFVFVRLIFEYDDGDEKEEEEEEEKEEEEEEEAKQKSVEFLLTSTKYDNLVTCINQEKLKRGGKNNNNMWKVKTIFDFKSGSVISNDNDLIKFVSRREENNDNDDDDQKCGKKEDILSLRVTLEKKKHVVEEGEEEEEEEEECEGEDDLEKEKELEFYKKKCEDYEKRIKTLEERVKELEEKMN